MKKYAILTAFVMGLYACVTRESEFDKLMAETMEIHDIDMKRLPELMILKSKAKTAIANAEPAELMELKQLLDDLERVDREMMQWMRNFSRVFPNGAMSHEGMDHSKMDHDEMSHSNHSDHSSIRSDLAKLKEERRKMDLMREQFNKSLDKAQSLLNAGS